MGIHKFCCIFAQIYARMNILIAIDNWFENLPYRRNKRIKQEIRAVLQQKRRILTTQQVEVCSQEVVNKLLALPAFQAAKRVLLYYPIHNEIDLRALLTAAPEKEYFLPVTHRKSIEVRPYDNDVSMKRGYFGIPEPQTARYTGKLDLVIVPAVAFDKANNRLGRGGGYYDRFLNYSKHTTKIGVGYKFQLKEHIPTDHHDKKMDAVVVSDTH